RRTWPNWWPRRAARDSARLSPSGADVDAEMLGDGEDVLVAAARQVHHHDVILGQFGRDLDDMGERMAGLQRRDDAFQPAEGLEGRQRLVIGHADIFGAALLLEPGMFRADAGIVEPGADRMPFQDLPL